ncbi:hypothetical protein [Vibrio sp. SCSIO 43136]|uniref:hypothetical protein n=1 Tax=Vibrio sp. SCSIO 43136 TaxID=2819101 RepID=UPI002075EF39|nr:hypothetical protein [Vibrio sp. SCSIO 43136]USD67845.1 hypothetical protein J4N39_16810 [Vibrio sp. SCSIO 43136]
MVKNTFASNTIIGLLGLSLIGCGGGSSETSEPTNPAEPPVNYESGEVVLSDMDLSRYTALGSIPTDTYMDQSVGILSNDEVELIEPGFGIVPDVDPSFGVIAPPSCLAFPTVDIDSIDHISPQWRIIKAYVPVHFTQCIFDQYELKIYLENEGKLYAFPEGYEPAYAYNHNELSLKVIQPNSTFNETDKPVISLRDTDNYGPYESVFFLDPETIEHGAKLELIAPNITVPDYRYNSFMYVSTTHAFIVDGKVTRQVELTSGNIVQTWQGNQGDSSHAITPFKYQSEMYTGESGDTFVKLNPDGTFGEQLPLPNQGFFGNNFSIDFVIDDRFIIGDRCTIWDMQNGIEHGVHFGSGSSETEVVDGVYYCLDHNSEHLNAFSFNLELGQVIHQEPLTSNTNVAQSLRMDAPSVMYSDTVDSVYETDHVSVNMLTGEKSVEKHYYSGDKVIDLTPIN